MVLSRLSKILLLLGVITLSVSGCSSFILFKQKLIQASGFQRAEIKQINRPLVKKTKPQKDVDVPATNCDYIIRDLSVPNATSIWCTPRIEVQRG